MKPKTQAIALAIGGALSFFALAFGRIDFNWFGFAYCGFTSLLGFFNWIKIDNNTQQNKSKSCHKFSDNSVEAHKGITIDVNVATDEGGKE